MKHLIPLAYRAPELHPNVQGMSTTMSGASDFVDWLEVAQGPPLGNAEVQALCIKLRSPWAVDTAGKVQGAAVAMDMFRYSLVVRPGIPKTRSLKEGFDEGAPRLYCAMGEYSIPGTTGYPMCVKAARTDC